MEGRQGLRRPASARVPRGLAVAGQGPGSTAETPSKAWREQGVQKGLPVRGDTHAESAGMCRIRWLEMSPQTDWKSVRTGGLREQASSARPGCGVLIGCWGERERRGQAGGPVLAVTVTIVITDMDGAPGDLLTPTSLEFIFTANK